MDFISLTPDQFENMTFDLLQAAGLRNLVWRTPGADGGRDLEGVFTSVDFSQHYQHQRWYVECKRYSNSIDWPTVWQKIAYADNIGADFLLLVTNSNPSPRCESEITAWNKRRRSVAVRIWRGYELEGILRNYPHVAAKYGLLGKAVDAELSLQSLMFETMKLAQTSYVGHELGVSNLSALETNAALAELISLRYSDIQKYGRITVTSSVTPPNYEWLSWTGFSSDWDEVGLRALLTMTRYLTGSGSIKAECNGQELKLLLINPRFEVVGAAEKSFAELTSWVDVEIMEVSKDVIRVAHRNQRRGTS
jgi:hypothetical protein